MKDKYGKELVIGDRVAFASVAKPHNNAYLNEGVITGFSSHPSFEYANIKTVKSHNVKKTNMEVIKIEKDTKKWQIGDTVFTLQNNHIYMTTITNIEYTINGWWYICSGNLEGLECMFADTVDEIVSRLTTNIENVKLL